MAGERHKLIRVSLALAALTLLARLLGGLLQIAIATRFGATSQLDAYLVALSLPNIVAEWFVVAAPAVVLVPLLAELRHDGLDEDAWRLICTFTNLLLVIVVAIVAVAFLAGTGVVRVLAPGLDSSGHALAASLLRWTSLMLLPAVGSGVLRALLYSYDRFLSPAIATAFSTSAAIVFVLVLSPTLGVKAIVLGLLAGATGALLVNLSASRGLWQRWYVGTNIRGALARRSLSLLATYLLIGTAAQLNFLSDRFFASFLEAGSISVLEYGEKLASVLMMVFATAVAIPAYTSLSRQVAAKNLEELRETVVSSTRLVAVVALPTLAIAIVLREPIVRVLLEHGLFTASDTTTVSTVFAYLCFVWCIYAFAQILTYAFFALQDTWRFLLVVTLGIALNIALDIVLLEPLGVYGLALATAIATGISNAILWRMLSRRLQGVEFRRNVPFAGKLLAAAAAAALAAVVVRSLLSQYLDAEIVVHQLAALAAPGLGAVLTYIAVCRLTGVEEIGRIWDSLTKRAAPRTPE